MMNTEVTVYACTGISSKGKLQHSTTGKKIRCYATYENVFSVANGQAFSVDRKAVIYCDAAYIGIVQEKCLINDRLVTNVEIYNDITGLPYVMKAVL